MRDIQIILSRTDSIGDVVLSLPLAGFLKKQMPASKIYFIGKSYTRPVIESSAYVDEFIDREEVINNPAYLAKLEADAIIYIYPDKEMAKAGKRAGIPLRVGTSHRFFHLLYCNKLVNLSRKNSALHEAQLNFSLLKPLGIEYMPQLAEIPELYGIKSSATVLPESIDKLVNPSLLKLIFHPKSKGSAREWPLANYVALAKLLPADKYQLFITGTAAEGELIRQGGQELFTLPHVVDVTGKLSLQQLITLINTADGLIACSTGPLHIAAALGKHALGIYPPIHPMDPGRWAPIGEKTQVLVLNKTCDDCRTTQNCLCIQSFTPETVRQQIINWTR